MKKLFMFLAFAGLCMTTSAQESDPTMKYSVATNSFWSNWFIQAGGDINLFKNQSTGIFPLSKNHDARSFGLSLALGKWFTPGMGLRLKADAPTLFKKKDGVNHGDLKLDVMFNFSNLFCGYSDTRVWNLTPFVGAGLIRNFSTDEYHNMLNVGILSTWKLCRNLSIYAEGTFIEAPKAFAWGTEGGKRGIHSSDKDLRAEIGLIFNLGKASWNKTPDVDAIKSLAQSQIDALNAQLNDANAENARLQKMLAEKPAQSESVKNFVNTPVSVFFNINKTKVANAKDLVNVTALAKYAKDNNSNVLVTGYADKATGTAAYNNTISEKRATTVADELVKMGVSRDNIKTQGNGGVEELSPISYNRRATVQIAE